MGDTDNPFVACAASASSAPTSDMTWTDATGPQEVGGRATAIACTAAFVCVATSDAGQVAVSGDRSERAGQVPGLAKR